MSYLGDILQGVASVLAVVLSLFALFKQQEQAKYLEEVKASLQKEMREHEEKIKRRTVRESKIIEVVSALYEVLADADNQVQRYLRIDPFEGVPVRLAEDMQNSVDKLRDEINATRPYLEEGLVQNLYQYQIYLDAILNGREGVLAPDNWQLADDLRAAIDKDIRKLIGTAQEG